MDRDQRQKRKHPRLRKILIWGAVAASAVLLILTALVVTAPRILSSGWMKTRVVDTAEQALQRPVRLDHLGFTWSDGLRIAGLKVAEDPAFSESDLFVLDRAHVAMSIPEFFPPRISVAVDLEGIHGQFIRNAEGRTNLEALLAPLKGEGGPEAPAESGPPPQVPVDLTVNIRIHDINLTAEDHETGRTIRLSEGRFDLAVPNLRSEPVTLTMASDLTVDGRTLPPLGFSLTAGDFIAEDGTPDPMGATAEMTADLPGTHLDGRINLQTWENSLDLTCDVAALTAAAKPLLPPEAAPDSAEGAIDLSLRTSGNPLAEVSFETTIAGSDLKISGGPLGAKSAGPFRFRMVQNGAYLPREERLIIGKGEFSLLDATRLAWSGDIQDLLRPEKQVDLAMQDIHLDIGELVGAARPFLPEGISVDFADPASPPSLTVDSVALAGTVPSGAEVRMNGLVLDMRGLNAAAGPLRLKDTGFNFTMPRLSASLNQFSPVDFEVDTGLDLSRLMVEGPVQAEISGVSVPLMRLTAGGMSGSKPMPEQVKVEASLGIETLRLPDTGLAVTKLDVPEFALTLAQLREVLMSAKIQMAGFQMGGDAPVSMENLALSDLSIRLNHPDLPSLLQKPKESEVFETAPGRHPGIAGENPASKAVGTDEISPSGTFAMNAALSFDALDLGGGTPIALKQVAVERFEVTGDRIPLPELVPGKVEMVSELSFDRLDVGGAQPAVLQEFHLDEARMQMDELALSPESRFGVSGRITLDQSLRLALARIPGRMDCRDLVQSFKTECRLKGEGAELRRMAFSVAEATLDAPPYGVFPVKLDAGADRIVLALDPVSADLEGVRLSAVVTPLLTVEAEIDAKGSGAEFLGTRGKARLDAGRLPEGLRRLLPRGMRVSGAAALDWSFSGRAPDAAEIETLRTSPRFNAEKDLPFLDVLDVGVAMDRVAFGMERAGAPELAVDRIDTPAPFHYRFERKTGQGKFAGRLQLAGIRNLAPIEKPLSMRVSMDGVHEGFQSLRLTQKMAIPLLNLDESLEISLSGLERMLRSSPMTAGWPKLNGKIRASFDSEQLPQLVPDVAVKGGLACGLELDLAADKRVQGSCWARTKTLDVAVKQLAEVSGMTVDLNLQKTYALASDDPSRPRSALLSTTVLASPFQGMDSDGIPAFLRKRLSVNPTVSFDAARILAGPVPFEVSRGSATFALNRGLPVLEPFQADALGGTILGAAAFYRSEDGIALDAGVAFTGIDPDTLLPPDVRSGDADREVNGRFRVRVPLSTDIRRLLRKMEADIHFSKIGSRALERFLYALDPYESNETIVSQRRLLRTGTPRWVRVKMANGGLSLSGEVSVKGARIAIPTLNRLQITQLPGLSAYGRDLARLETVIHLLERMAADRILVDQNGNIKIGENR